MAEDEAENSQLVDMNKQLNVASFDDVGDSPEQDQAEFEEEALPRKKRGGKRAGKKSAPSRSKIVQEHENAVKEYLEAEEENTEQQELEGQASVPKSRRGAASTRSKKSPQKSVASKATSKKQVSKRGKSTRGKKTVESVQDD